MTPSSVAGVILAAGFGTRLALLTDHTPKPMLEVGGRPLVDHLVERMASVGVVDPVVVVNGRHPDQFHRWAAAASRPARIVDNGVTHDGERLGAVADLLLAMTTHPRPDATAWLVVAGDNLVAASDLAAMLTRWATAGHPVVGCRDLGTVPPGRHGEVTVDADGAITRFREKPAEPETPIVATCTYVLPPDAPELVAAHLAGGGDPDSPGRFVAALTAARRVDAHLLAGAYHDIGTPETLAAARADHPA